MRPDPCISMGQGYCLTFMSAEGDRECCSCLAVSASLQICEGMIMSA